MRLEETCLRKEYGLCERKVSICVSLCEDELVQAPHTVRLQGVETWCVARKLWLLRKKYEGLFLERQSPWDGQQRDFDEDRDGVAKSTEARRTVTLHSAKESDLCGGSSQLMWNLKNLWK